MNASTAGSARPSFSPDSRLSEWRISRGTRGFVITAEESTGSVGESRAPTRNDSVQSRSVSAWVASGHEHARERHREDELPEREVPRLLKHLLLHLEPVAEQDQDQRHHREALHELPRRVELEHLEPPSPSTKPATTKAAVRDRKPRASPEMSAPPTSSTPKTASGASRNSTPAASGGTGELCQTTIAPSGYGDGRDAALLRPCDSPDRPRRAGAAALAQGAPRASARSRAAGRCAGRRPPPRRPRRRRPRRPRRRARRRRARHRGRPRRTGARRVGRPPRAERVRHARAAELYPGQVRRYRVSFRGPPTPRGFSWLLRFESVRRNAAVILNGRRIGRNVDPYTPFTLEARGLRPGRTNELVVIVDGRKNPDLPEGWWNWNGIVRPVELVPAGPAHIQDLGTMSRVQCRGPARGCRAELLLDGMLQRRGVRLDRAVARREAALAERPRDHAQLPAPAPARSSGASSSRCPCRRRSCGHRTPQLYAAEITLRERGRVVQRERRRIGLRSVEVKQGHLWLNNRRIQLRGASIHEDMPGSGAALTAPTWTGSSRT